MADQEVAGRLQSWGYRMEAVAPVEEAVRLYRELAGANPAFLPNLAGVLTNLGSRYSEAGTSNRGDAAWERGIAEAAPSAAAYLLLARTGAADTGHPGAVAWLARALAADIKDQGLLDVAHVQARRHRGPDPAAFDRNWAGYTGGPVPVWLTVDPGLLSSAQAWVATDTYTAERDHLAAHPELLEAAADIAVAEAMLAVSEDDVTRYAALRQVAQQDGADAAYQPLLRTILAQEFAGADPDRQRALLADRRDDLLTGTVADTLNELARQEDQQAMAAQHATAPAQPGWDRPGRAGLRRPGRPRPVPRLLHTLAMQSDAGSVAPSALVAYTAATSITEAAAALFYLAVGVAAGGDQEQAVDLIRQARAADPAQVPGWINELAEVGQHHPGVLQLIPALTEQSAPSEPPPEDTR